MGIRQEVTDLHDVVYHLEKRISDLEVIVGMDNRASGTEIIDYRVNFTKLYRLFRDQVEKLRVGNDIDRELSRLYQIKCDALIQYGSLVGIDESCCE